MRLKFIPPFKSTKSTPTISPFEVLQEIEKEGLLQGIEWDLDEGIPWTSVGNREDLANVVPGVLKLVREACETGKYHAIVILGGLEPGLYAAKEIGAQYGIPVVGATSSEVIFAYALGHRYSVIDVLEAMAITIRQNLMSYGMNEKCASVRSIEIPMAEFRARQSEALEAFMRESIDAIEKDGADVIVCGCSLTYFLQPMAQKRLKEMGYDVPVLHGYKCAIELAKALVNLRVSQGQIAFPSKKPKKRAVPH